MEHRMGSVVSIFKISGVFAILMQFLMHFIVSDIYAATEIPHTFKAGALAKSSEINENFSALANAIDTVQPGIQGPQGIQGNRGPQGLQGDRGPKGLQGDKGLQGIQGDTGSQGIQGDRGLQGLQGDRGPQGFQGDEGLQGVQGDRGLKGLDGTAILPNEVRDKFFSGFSCKGNDAMDIMVKVGPLCVDKYEASVWNGPTNDTASIQYGGLVPGYPCKQNGNNCSDINSSHVIFARSVEEVFPSRDITWFQAQQACAMSGKRLLTNAEWQMAAAGTPDPETDVGDGNNCAVESHLSKTGSRTDCVSNWEVNDMVGNLSEWVADWVQGNQTIWAPGPSNALTDNEDYGADHMVGTNPARIQGTDSRFLAAIYRGGSWNSRTAAGVFALNVDIGPDVHFTHIGFRCAR